MVRSVTVREAEFDREDLLLLRAHQYREDTTGSHGIPMDEATDPANQFAFEASAAPTVDWAEATRAAAIEAYYKQYPDANRAGHLWGVTRRK